MPRPELAAATGEPGFHEAGRRALSAFGKQRAAAKPGPGSAEWALAQRTLLAPEVPEAPAWRTAAAAPVQPRVIVFKPSKGLR